MGQSIDGLGSRGVFEQPGIRNEGRHLGLGCVVYTMKTMVFEGFTVSSEDGISNIVRCLGTSFSEVLGYLGCHFRGLGGS